MVCGLVVGACCIVLLSCLFLVVVCVFLFLLGGVVVKCLGVFLCVSWGAFGSYFWIFSCVFLFFVIVLWFWGIVGCLVICFLFFCLLRVLGWFFFGVLFVFCVGVFGFCCGV